MRAIENEMWTRLDDVVPLQIQKEFRERLNLHVSGEAQDLTGMAPSVGGPAISLGLSLGPGVIGWSPGFYPLQIEIARSGRWFTWAINSENSIFLPSDKAPTLPTALQRFYREPGPWMAIANARFAINNRNGAILNDQWTAAGKLRETLLEAALRAKLTAIRLASGDKAAEIADEYSERMSQEYRLWTNNGDRLPPDVQERIIALAQASDPEQLDSVLEKEAATLQPDQLRTSFIGAVILSLAFEAERPESALMGLRLSEVSSYSETGDVASAILSIPDQPPVPVRFRRESGIWKIDSIGSNERFLESLKQMTLLNDGSRLASATEVMPSAPTSETAVPGSTMSDSAVEAPPKAAPAVNENLVPAKPAIVFEDSVPRLNAGLFKLTDEQLANVNAILKETHERYLKAESQHAIVSVDSEGVQTTEIQEFASSLRAIENDMWTKLDDAVPVEIQTEFRSQLNLYDSEEPIVASSAASVAPAMPGGWIYGSEVRGPGLLGWSSQYFPLTIAISRSGRWFEYSLKIGDAVIAKKSVPELPTELQHTTANPVHGWLLRMFELRSQHSNGPSCPTN